MRVHIGGDHAAYEMLGALVVFLEEEGHQVTNHGPISYDEDDDYPEAWLEPDPRGNLRLKRNFRAHRAREFLVEPDGTTTKINEPGPTLTTAASPTKPADPQVTDTVCDDATAANQAAFTALMAKYDEIQAAIKKVREQAVGSSNLAELNRQVEKLQTGLQRDLQAVLTKSQRDLWLELRGARARGRGARGPGRGRP